MATMKTAILLLATTLLAQADPDARYRACMERVDTDPQAALQAAEDWAGDGGGALAEHCKGSALLSLERFEEGARLFDGLAERMAPEAPPLAARIAYQASRGWQAMGEPERALVSMGRALSYTPDDPVLRLRRGLMRALTGAYFAALDAFNAVLDRNPENVDALVLRASTYRRLESPELARDDLSRALRLDPDHPDALLERGLVNAVAGDAEAARADWERVKAVAPESRAAQLSREYLERLERYKG